MRKLILLFVILALSFTLVSSPALATSLWFDPVEQHYDIGDTLSIDLFADIDESDAIFGFGFDLSFNDGVSYISDTGESGSYLTFTGFTPNSTHFQYDSAFPPLWADGDTIAGEVLWGNDDVWGADILLGTFYFDAPGSGPIGVENIYLGAPDPNDLWTPDGLFMGDIFSPIAFMPNNPTASAAPVPVPVPVPEPATMLLFGSGLVGFMGLRKKFGKG